MIRFEEHSSGGAETAFLSRASCQACAPLAPGRPSLAECVQRRQLALDQTVIGKLHAAARCPLPAARWG